MDEPRQPVIVGVGEVANTDDDRIVHPLELLAEAVDLAAADSGVGRRLLDRVGLVGAAPLSIYSDDDAAAMVAARFDLARLDTIETGYSGAGPLRLLAEAGRRIGAGELDAALLVGGVADASVKRARLRGEDPPAPPTSIWSQGSRHQAPVPAGRRRPVEGPLPAEIAAGAHLPVQLFALIESAMASHPGETWAEHRARLGRLMAPFTEVAAGRGELAWFPRVRTPAELATVRPDNRLVAQPYTKSMCSFPTVDLAAAVLVCAAEVADRLGVPAERRVHPWALATAKERVAPSGWPSMDRAPSLEMAGRHVLDHTGTDAAALAALDLYSCFPAAVQLGLSAFGVPTDDPRPFTLTGGLPYFGGPGASYGLHGLAAAAGHCRRHPGAVVGLTGVGGMPSDFAAGLVSTAPPEVDPSFVELEPPPSPVRTAPPGVGSATGTVVAMTVVHGPDGEAEAAPLVAELADGTRVGARPEDPDLPGAFAEVGLVGREVRLRAHPAGTTYSPA
jgi:acetyl-CoA C-acetyltransferase